MPGGIGLHPYFQHHPDAKLAFGARRQWRVTSDYLPQDDQAVPTENRHAVPCALPAGTLTDYWADWDGTASLDLPSGARLRMETGPSLRHLVVHRPPSLNYLRLESVSHVANAFNLAARGVADTSAVWLKSGESLLGQVRFYVADQA